MDRSKMISQLEDPSEVFDFLVIGGGATGIGIALDASTRGYRVALFEQSDFTKGTSSRSTKLVHGGVRYLAQGDISLVLEALRIAGRTDLIGNGPHCLIKGDPAPSSQSVKKARGKNEKRDSRARSATNRNRKEEKRSRAWNQSKRPK